ncbi:MAG: heavy-metal-associated domain-containing protein [Tenericutes bacterium]|nr:heavy-metal-associated domain-containing protein [Mycoplasmatota bacterium]
MKNYQLIIRIDSITCVGCMNRITQTLTAMGADQVDIDISTKIAKIFYEGLEEDGTTYFEAVNHMGYPSEYLVLMEVEQ